MQCYVLPSQETKERIPPQPTSSFFENSLLSSQNWTAVQQQNLILIRFSTYLFSCLFWPNLYMSHHHFRLLALDPTGIRITQNNQGDRTWCHHFENFTLSSHKSTTKTQDGQQNIVTNQSSHRAIRAIELPTFWSQPDNDGDDDDDTNIHFTLFYVEMFRSCGATYNNTKSPSPCRQQDDGTHFRWNEKFHNLIAIQCN